MRRIVMLAVCFVLYLLPASAQDKPQQNAPDLTIKSYTKLVQVPAVVTDKSGAPVHGLTKDDFILLEDGKQVQIASFQAATHGEAVTTRPQLPPGQFTNVIAGKPMERPIIILVIDSTNSDFFNQAQSRRHLIKFLSEKIEPGTLMSLMISTRYGFRSVHEYTTAPSVLIEALKRVTSVSASVGNESAPPAPSTTPASPSDLGAAETQALQAFINAEGEFQGLQRGAYTSVVLQGLRAIAQRFAGVPGRKALIWAAGHFPFFGDDPTSISSADYRGRYLQTFEQLNDANIAVYPLDAGGLIGYSGAAISTGAEARNPGGTGNTMASNQILGGNGDTALGRINEVPKPIDNMKTVAELTGGVPYYGTNDLSGAMRKAVADSTDYYMLGYYLHGGPDAKLGRRKLKVEVRKPGLKVRGRERVYVTPLSLSPRNEMSAALRTPLEFTNIPIVVKFDPKDASSAGGPFEIALQGRDVTLAENDNTINVSFVVEARTAEGTVLDHIDQTLSGKVQMVDEFRARPFLYTNKLRPLANAATVRFIVRDNNSGKMGSVIVETKKAQ